MNDDSQSDRRAFLKKAVINSISGIAMVSGMAALAAPPHLPDKVGTLPAEEAEKEITPTEDLMQEHGLLNRILLIYDRAIEKLSSSQKFPREVIVKAAGHIRTFIEDYHEHSEESIIFPRLLKAGKLPELVSVLLSQHKAARRVTADIQSLTATEQIFKDNTGKLIAAMSSFNRMYRPHEAREDTVIFPEFRNVVSESELHDIGEAFEKREHELFGKEGFEGVVAQVAQLEKTIGIYDLNQFTP